jgi:hypothetical protein
MQKRAGSFWTLMLESAWPKIQVIEQAQDELVELIRFYATQQQRATTVYPATALTELKQQIRQHDLFPEPQLTIITGVLTTTQSKVLLGLNELLPEEHLLWHVTSAKRSSLSWPVVTYTPPTTQELSRLFNEKEIEHLTSLVDPEDLLSLLQLLQKSALGLTLTPSMASPIEGSCWDLFNILIENQDIRLSIEQMTQLTFAFEMIHQVSTLTKLSEHFYFPPKIKSILRKEGLPKIIEQELLPCYQKILQALLMTDQNNAAYFIRLWIKYFVQQVH